MTLSENKNLHRREAMPFPFRWKDSLKDLPDSDFREMIMAILKYGEHREEPDFQGFKLVAWREFKDRIDYDAKQYEHRCNVNQENANLRWNKKYATAYHRIRTNANDAKGDGEGDGDGEGLKENTKETAKPFSLTSETSKPIPYTKWTPEQFRSEIDKYPEYSVYADEFFAYWTESTAKGMMFFQTQPKWETLKRLQMWQRKHAKWNPLSSGYGAANSPNQEQQLSPEEQFKQMNGIS